MAPVEEKTTRCHLRWCGHAHKNSVTTPLQGIVVTSSMNQGKEETDLTIGYINIVGVTENIALNRIEYNSITHKAIP